MSDARYPYAKAVPYCGERAVALMTGPKVTFLTLEQARVLAAELLSSAEVAAREVAVDEAS